MALKFKTIHIFFTCTLLMCLSSKDASAEESSDQTIIPTESMPSLPVQHLSNVTRKRCTLGEDIGYEAQNPDLLPLQWRLKGRFIDDVKSLRKYLTPFMADIKNWSEQDQCELHQIFEDLGYHSTITSKLINQKSIDIQIRLTPSTLVRHLHVNIDINLIDRFKQPLFEDELRGRMKIRPGFQLPESKQEIKDLLVSEKKRLFEYLKNDGFYENKVDITIKRSGPYRVNVFVVVDPGPPYFIGRFDGIKNKALSVQDVQSFFSHDRICLLQICIFTKRYSKRLFNEDLEKLTKAIQKKGFPGARVQKKSQTFNRDKRQVETVLEIRERRKIDVVFEGNVSRSEKKLLPKITLSEEGSYDDIEVELSAAAIRRDYQSKGYFEVSVSWERVLLGEFQRIIFTIDEGPKLYVRRIEFGGNTGVNTEELSKAIKTAVYKKFVLGASGGFATTVQLERDMVRIAELYRSKGFYGTEVSVDVKRDNNKTSSAPLLAASIAGSIPSSGLYLVYNIKEGTQVLTHEVRLKAIDNLVLIKQTEPDLREYMSLEQGTPFLIERAENDNKTIKNYFEKKGYPRVEVNTQTCFENESTPCATTPVGPDSKASITHEITLHRAAKVGKTIIRGNFKTKEWVIRDELGMRENELLTSELMNQAQGDLRQSGLFSGVQIHYEGLKTIQRDIVNILVNVEERHDLVLQGDVGGGYSTDSKQFVEGRLGTRNFLGTGITLDGQLLWGTERKQLLGNLVLPRWVLHSLIGRKLSTTLNLTWRRDKTERFGELSTWGLSVAMTKEWRRGFLKYVSLRFLYDFRLRQRDIDFVRPAGNSIDITKDKVETRSSEIGPQLIIDTRRDYNGSINPLSPARGYRILVSGSRADNFFGQNRFWKFDLNGQYFFPIGSRITISNGVRYDHGFPIGSALLPEVERFYAGGDTTVRGYEEDRFAKEYIENDFYPLNGSSRFRVLPAGGNLRLLHNIDLQINLWEDPFLGFPVASALFVDTGLIANSWDNFDLGDLRHSLGVSLIRWAFPFGSVSVEWAYPLTPERGDNPLGRVHFNVGVIF